ncbi:hypothetical protein KCT31_002640 [Enterococcus faecalis]|nr:hypothetical protein [Enterococcus faecalis]
MINITLIKDLKEIDMSVPIQITFGRLKVLIQELFEENGIFLDNFDLLFIDKALDMEESDFLSDFGVANGDRLKIVTGEN